MSSRGKWLIAIGTSVLAFGIGVSAGFITLERDADTVSEKEDTASVRKLVRATDISPEQKEAVSELNDTTS